MKRRIAFRKNEGITLIALVVTIVVLLILAGVTITMVLGEDGVLRQAQLAAEKTKEADEKERADLQNLVGIIDEAVNGEDPKTLKEALEKQKYFSYTTKYDTAGNKIEEDSENPTKTPAITIPAGFKVAEGDVNNIEQGIVISDRDGNEFVWVPCTSTEYVKHTYIGDTDDVGKNIEDTGNVGWNTWYYRAYKDWTGDSSQENANKTSVEKYGGFYIARYEAGVPSDASFYVPATESGSKTYATNKNVNTYAPVSKKEMQAWNYISQTNAKTVSEKMYIGSGSVISRLVDGIAWDRTVDWIAEDENLAKIVREDSTTKGNYANNSGGSKITTSSPILWAEHLYKYEQRDGTTVAIGWCPAKIYRYDAQFSSGYSANWTTLTDADKKYSNYVSTGFTYNHYVEMATGASESTKLKNIYDLGVNMYEWTTERGSHKTAVDNTTTYDQKTHAVLRGGSFDNYGNDNPVSIRNGNYGVSGTSPHFGFRVVLYVKK